MLEEWEDWVEARSHQHVTAPNGAPAPAVGGRRPLGFDARGRSYWALGGATGAWRVYCQEPGANTWVRAQRPWPVACTRACLAMQHGSVRAVPWQHAA
jgi:hypothetical protein